MVQTNWQLSQLESGVWTPEQGPTINPTIPTDFRILPYTGGLIIYCSGVNYSGALAKQVNPLLYPSASITFSYSIWFGPAIAYAQVIETDTKITDAAGWTYDGSLQFNLAEGWMIQTRNPWVDTGTKIPLKQNQWNDIAITYALNYAAHTLQITLLTAVSGGITLGTMAAQPPYSATQAGWTPNEIVTQLQLCIGANPGAYDLMFTGMEYSG